MGDDHDADLIGLYIAWLDASGRRSLRSIESTLRTVDRAPELAYGLPYASQAELIKLFARRRPGGAPVWEQATRAGYRARLAGFFRWAVRSGELDFDPTGGLPKIRMPRGLPRPVDDVTLLTALDGAAPWPWLHLSMVLAGWAGLRCCEIALLRGDDVTDQLVTVRRGKGGRPREVPTHARVWAAVADLPGGSVMEATGGQADADWLSRAARYRLRRLGVAEGGLHRWRHTCATRLLASGANIRVVQEVLGHESLTSTQIYTDVSAEMQTAMSGMT